MRWIWVSILGIMCIASILWFDSQRGREGFQSADEYLAQKFGEFRPAIDVGTAEINIEPVPELEGKEFLTLKDMLTVKLAIDNQITRLETVRSSAANYQEKQTQLEELSFRLSNILSAINRKDATVSDYPIRTTTAKRFLETFRQGDKVPVLFDVPAPAPVAAEEPPLFALVQKLKMELEQLSTQDKDSSYLLRVGALERRILNSSMLGNPIPSELRKEFLNVLKEIYTDLVIQ